MAATATSTTTAMSPMDAITKTLVTSQDSPLGTGVTALTTARSLDGLTLMANQHSRITRTDSPTRNPSLPRRRVWPSPTGANRIARHVFPARGRRGRARFRWRFRASVGAGTVALPVSAGAVVAPSPIRADIRPSVPTGR